MHVCSGLQNFIHGAGSRRSSIITVVPQKVTGTHKGGIVATTNVSMVDHDAAQLVDIVSIEREQGLVGHGGVDFLSSSRFAAEVPTLEVQHQHTWFVDELGCFCPTVHAVAVRADSVDGLMA